MKILKFTIFRQCLSYVKLRKGKNMNILKFTIFIIVISLFCFSGCDQTSQESPEPNKSIVKEKVVEKTAQEIEQKTCPVMGGKINKNIVTEYKGKKVYFCCAGCVEKFKKNPDKYISKLPQFKEKDVIEQKNCPVMGGKINKNIFVEYKGKKVYFCCEGCDDMFNKNPEKYLSKLPQFKKK